MNLDRMQGLERGRCTIPIWESYVHPSYGPTILDTDGSSDTGHGLACSRLWITVLLIPVSRGRGKKLKLLGELPSCL